MATVSVQKSDDQQHAVLYLWGPLTSTDQDGEAVELPDHADKSVQLIGTFTATTCLIEGSNDGTNWATLNDPNGNALSYTGAGLAQVLEHTRYIRPRLSASGGSSNVNVYLYARAPR